MLPGQCPSLWEGWVGPENLLGAVIQNQFHTTYAPLFNYVHLTVNQTPCTNRMNIAPAIESYLDPSW